MSDMSSVRASRAAAQATPPIPRVLPGLDLGAAPRLSAVDTVRARIGMAVDLGLLKPGDRLPPTDSISRSMEVSDITVRRALESLCDEGVLERRRGRTGGTMVASTPRFGAVAEISAYRAATDQVHDLIDRRILFECGVAHLAAQSVTETQLADLQSLVDAMETVETWSEFHSLDARFHLATAEATGVASATVHYGEILRALYAYYVPYPIEFLHDSNREHRQLVIALRAHDPMTAVGVARRHVEALHETMFVGLAEPRASSVSPDPALRRSRARRPAAHRTED